MADDEQNLPEADLRHLLGYIGVVRDALRLQAWDVILRRDPIDPSAEAHAEMWWSQVHATVTIRVDPTMLGGRPDFIRNAVVHELVHSQHRDLSLLWSTWVENDTTSVVDQQAATEEFHRYVERFVSWVATAVEENVPLPGKHAEYEIRRGCYLSGEERA